jgi:hypothetical protein
MMVDEFLSEREQAEQLRLWLRENWIWLVAGVALTLGGYYGYRWWEGRVATRSLEAGERFAAMLDAIAAGKKEEGLKLADAVTGEYAGTPYADQALLVLARLDVDNGDLARPSPRNRRTRTSGWSRASGSRACSSRRDATTRRSQPSRPSGRLPSSPACSSCRAT